MPSLHQLQLPETPCFLNAPLQASLNPWALSPTSGLRLTPEAALRGPACSLAEL